MKVVKTMLIAGAGIGVGMLVANHLTDGAVFEAVSTIFANVKDGVMEKTQDAAEVVTEVVETVADATEAL